MKIIGPVFHGSYETGRGMAQVISGLGWLVVAIGFFVTLASLGSMGVAGPFAMLGVTTGILIAVVGVLQVAAGQGVRAALDAADYARQSLQLQIAQAEGRNEVDLRVAYSPHGDHAFRGVSQVRESGSKVVEEGTYKGRMWRRLEDGTVEGELLGGRFRAFASLEEFQRYIA